MLTSSGAVAFALMGASLHRGTLDADVRERISKLLCIPLIVTMVGLVASATHLGNPDNALYVIAGIGLNMMHFHLELAGAISDGTTDVDGTSVPDSAAASLMLGFLF